jgi:hypothetical protein
MEIETDILHEHSELIKIFLNANDLDGVRVESYDQDVNGILHLCIKLVIDSDDDSEKLTAMGLRNYGVKNMLDHFLLKCGISPFGLHARHYKDPTQLPLF